MTKEIKKWVRQEYPQKAERIISKSLSQKKIEAAGIKLKKHEIFVQYPGYPDYFGSNYGRVISLKGGTPSLLTQTIDNKGYVVYTFTRPALRRYGKKIGESKPFPITGHRLVADLFLPNYWIEMDRDKLDTHHLDHNRRNNKWTNLILVPKKLHYRLNRLDGIWFYTGKSYRRRTPYQIQRQTDMSLDDILLPLKRKDYLDSVEDGHSIRVYNVGAYFIGFQLTEAAIRAEKKTRKN